MINRVRYVLRGTQDRGTRTEDQMHVIAKSNIQSQSDITSSQHFGWFQHPL